MTAAARGLQSSQPHLPRGPAHSVLPFLAEPLTSCAWPTTQAASPEQFSHSQNPDTFQEEVTDDPGSPFSGRDGSRWSCFYFLLRYSSVFSVARFGSSALGGEINYSCE